MEFGRWLALYLGVFITTFIDYIVGSFIVHDCFLTCSIGIGCGQVNVPGVYVKVSHYLDWIGQLTQQRF